MQNYLDFLQYIQAHGHTRTDRTGVGTRSVFGYQMRFDLQAGFPLVTTKAIHLRSVIHELLWFLKGDTNVKYLQRNGVKIWNEWADKAGDLGPVYGKQWRAWESADGRVIDQIKTVMQAICQSPHSRRLVVSAWNVGELHKMALPPCHLLFQFYVQAGRLSCQLTQRSADAFLGVPFNIASYALLTHLVAQQCHLDVGEFIWSGGDCHLYNNHLTQAKEQCARNPYPLPRLHIKRRPAHITDYVYADFTFENYRHHPKLSAPIAV